MMLRTITAMLAVCVLYSAASGQTLAADEALVPSVTVAGSGEVTAKPDMATIQVGVVSQAETASEALESNSESMRQLMQTLQDEGLAEKDIQTSQFGLAPRYDRDPEAKRSEDRTKIVGYEVTNRLEIKVRKLAMLGELLDKLVGEGANQVHGISFSVADPQRLLDDARRKAMADARRKAKLYAEASDAALGRTLLIREETPHPVQPQYFRATLAAADSSVPIAAGELTFHAQIQVTYELE